MIEDLKLDLTFKNFKKELKKRLLEESEVIVDIIPIVLNHMKDLTYPDRPSFCMRVQKLIEDYNNEGVIETGKEYHSILATLPSKVVIPRVNGLQVGMDTEFVAPEIFVRSTEKFEKIYGEKEVLPPTPSSPTTIYNIGRYENNSINATGSAGSFIGGSGNEVNKSFNRNENAKAKNENSMLTFLSKFWWQIVAVGGAVLASYIYAKWIA